jgi:hypothetical protein
MTVVDAISGFSLKFVCVHQFGIACKVFGVLVQLISVLLLTTFFLENRSQSGVVPIRIVAQKRYEIPNTRTTEGAIEVFFIEVPISD